MKNLEFTYTYINVKTSSLKKVCNEDMAYITQAKTAKIKRCYYFGSTSP